MFRHWKIICGLVSALWVLLAWHFIALEIINLDSTTWVITGTINIVALVSFHVNFIYVYLKNKKRIKDLQDQYIETLKPDKPLRFCPTDDELMKSHLEQMENNINAVEETNVITQEETFEEKSEELENS